MIYINLLLYRKKSLKIFKRLEREIIFMILLITANGYCTELYFGEDMENIIKILEIMVALLFGLLMLFIATYIILLLYNVGKYIIYKIEQKVINKKK